jgi:hypothetical protein
MHRTQMSTGKAESYYGHCLSLQPTPSITRFQSLSARSSRALIRGSGRAEQGPAEPSGRQPPRRTARPEPPRPRGTAVEWGGRCACGAPRCCSPSCCACPCSTSSPRSRPRSTSPSPTPAAAAASVSCPSPRRPSRRSSGTRPGTASTGTPCPPRARSAPTPSPSQVRSGKSCTHPWPSDLRSLVACVAHLPFPFSCFVASGDDDP